MHVAKVNKTSKSIAIALHNRKPTRLQIIMARNHREVLSALSTLQTQDLSIIRLSEPISFPNAPVTTNRSSDVSIDAFENPSPASLEADLSHYTVRNARLFSSTPIITTTTNFANSQLIQELFSKLRFSYLEQVTKEKFLRAIVGDPPLIVEQQENVELEAQLAVVKAELKAQKVEVAGMVEELEARGRELSRRMFGAVHFLPTVEVERVGLICGRGC